MALFSFSQKNKTPADPAQTPAAPPKLQPPPPPAPSASNTPPPAPTPPPPTAPSLGKTVSATTRGVTQPIVMPKRGPGAPVRSTQRIVVPGAATPPEAAPQFHTSSIQLPVAMILRAIQMPALAGPLADLEKTPQGQQKVSVPLSMILPQLPSGKIEISMQDVVPLIPAELLASRDRLAPYLSSSIHLPLMEVVMLIPPDMLALRPDQKQVDTSVTSMADPFTEESIRKAAEENRREKAAAESGVSGPEFGAAERPSTPLAAGMTSTAPMPRTSRPTPPSTTSAPPPMGSQPPPPPPRTPMAPAAQAPSPAPTAPPTMPPVTRLPTPSTMSRPGTISLPMVNRPGAKPQTTPPPAPEPVAPPPQSFAPPQPARTPTPSPLSRPPLQRTPPPAPTPPPPPEPQYEEADQETEYPGQEEPQYEAQAEPEPEPAPAPTPEPPKQRPAGPLNLNTCTAEDLAQIPGISAPVAQSIVTYRQKIGAFRKLQDLLDVPGMTRGIYGLLTGEESQPTTVNDLLGFPTEQNLTLKDITERIACWPDVTGCILGQSNGLPIMGHLSPKVKMDKAAIMAFAPRMFEALNKSFVEMSGASTDELIIPTSDTSFHILRKGELYLIILARTPQMPSRHLQVARLVLASLNFK